VKKYTIMVREAGADHEVEFCQCDSNPGAIVEAAQQKYRLVDGGISSSRKIRVPKYEHVYFRENVKNEQ